MQPGIGSRDRQRKRERDGGSVVLKISRADLAFLKKALRSPKEKAYLGAVSKEFRLVEILKDTKIQHNGLFHVVVDPEQCGSYLQWVHAQGYYLFLFHTHPLSKRARYSRIDNTYHPQLARYGFYDKEGNYIQNNTLVRLLFSRTEYQAGIYLKETYQPVRIKVVN